MNNFDFCILCLYNHLFKIANVEHVREGGEGREWIFEYKIVLKSLGLPKCLLLVEQANSEFSKSILESKKVNIGNIYIYIYMINPFTKGISPDIEPIQIGYTLFIGKRLRYQ
jgi:hypothetical protein